MSTYSSANINSVACVHTHTGGITTHMYEGRKDSLNASVGICPRMMSLKERGSNGDARIKCQRMYHCVYMYAWTFMSEIISILLFLLLLYAGELNRQMLILSYGVWGVYSHIRAIRHALLYACMYQCTLCLYLGLVAPHNSSSFTSAVKCPN